ncbi:MAG: cation:proton antiporter [Gemmatimonadota bacterium]|nr:MAG: cation:proton antiporter [Gemmatimonadota bacterium]
MAFGFGSVSARRIGRLLTLVVIALLAALFRAFGPLTGPATSTLLLGFLLLAAFVAGELARDVGLPRITGYLAIGLLFGPHVLRLLPQDTVEGFRLINDVALSVIALQAGGELRASHIGERLANIVTTTVLQIALILVGVTAAVFLASGLFPALAGQGGRVVLAVALIFGLVAVANSPATIIAVMTELRARGPLADTVLGVSVFKDVLVLLLIAVVIPAAIVLVEPARGFDLHQVGELSLRIGLALACGGAVGWLIGLYLEKVAAQPILFVLAVAFGIVELTEVLGLESEFYILLSMSAGFVVQNFSIQGPRFVRALEANSLPLYALFFAVAGADLDLGAIPVVWKVGIVIIVVRAALMYLSTLLGAVATGEPPVIRQHAWVGFIAQAGVTLGLATIVRDRFAEWGGDQVAAVIIAMIAVNQLVGPPLFRLALLRGGEASPDSGRLSTR